MAVLDRIKKAWNAFAVSKEEGPFSNSYGTGSSALPDRTRPRSSNERSIISSIYTRISIDVAGVPFRHVKLDDMDRYSNDVKSKLNDALNWEPNLDQGPRQFRQDIAMAMLTEGVAVIVPVDTTVDPDTNEIFDIFSLRVGRVVDWRPAHVKVSLYNEGTGKRQDVFLQKQNVAIIVNPFYAVMNEPNSTLQRLIRKLSLLDFVDEQSGNGKLDLLIQLPYTIKTEAKREQAEKRREDIEFQLRGSKYGIAYTDGTEKITQLNRPAENNLLTQIESLTKKLYEELGITEGVMSGSAAEADMINYYVRTVEPILDVIAEGMQKAFLGLVGANRKERIRFFRDPFKLVPVKDIAEIADKFTRNEVMTSNEIRGAMGLPPSSDPKADQLVNSNMPQPAELSDPSLAVQPPVEQLPPEPSAEDSADIELLTETIDSLTADLEELA